MALLVALGAGCGLENKRGVELGHLRDLARRVEGGGAECPLAIPARLLRPSTVDPETPVEPLRVGVPGAVGVVGDGLPTDESVTVTCRYRADDVSVTLAVAGVSEGHAIAVFGDRLAKRGDGATVLPFIDVNGELPVGRASALPGEPPAAFTRVSAATGDIALVLSVDRLDADARIPAVGEIERNAVDIAATLAD
ncbi:MAG TPA: hypothetical protein VFN21_01705 [Acidimicrobiales bacterium]|nr:hypothetical protein [Acidimicrobiales bacterium]